MDEKSMKKSFSGLGLRFLIGTLIIYAVQIAVMGVVGMVKPEWLENTTINLILAVLPLYLIGMPVLIALVKQMPGEAPVKKSITPGQFVVALIMCYALMYCGNLVGTLITTVVGALKGSEVDNALMAYATESNMIVTFLYMVICAPILEEYIFRKLIVDRTLKYGQGVAIILSGLMFGLFHGNLNQFAYAMLLGMFLAFLYVKTGNLKITIGLHMCINFMGAVVSVLLLKAIHLDEYQEIVMNGGDAQAVMDFMMAYLPGWIGYMVYVLFILAVVITGIVLFIVFRKRFALDPGQIPKGQRFKTVICNPGMLCYCIFWIVMILIEMATAQLRNINVPLYRICLYFAFFRYLAIGRVVKCVEDERLRKLLKAAMWGMLVIIWIYQAYIQGNNAICPYTSEILHIGRETFF